MSDVRLRRATPDDLDFLLDVFSDDDVRPFLAAGKRARPRGAGRRARAAGATIRRRTAASSSRSTASRAGDARVRARQRAQQDRALGGLAVHPRFRGRRLADDAARLFQRHLIFDLGYHRLEMVVYGFNERAQRHAERAGWIKEGVKRKAYLRGDEWVDGVMYAAACARISSDDAARRAREALQRRRPLRRLRADARELRRRRDDGVRRRSRRAVRRPGRDRRGVPRAASRRRARRPRRRARTATRSSRATRGGASRTCAPASFGSRSRAAGSRGSS